MCSGHVSTCPQGIGPSIGSRSSSSYWSPFAYGRYTLFHWDYGFREGPVFAHSYSQNSYDNVHYWEVLVGWLFNVFYYIFILLILTAVVSGIIIDSFAELRAENKTISDDIRNNCFMCVHRKD